MKKSLVEKFRDGKIAVYVKDREQANKFIDWCYDNNMEWYFGDRKTFFTDVYIAFNFDNDNTLGYSDLSDTFTKEGWEVISFDDFFKFTKDDIKDGMVIETRDGKRYLILNNTGICEDTYLPLETHSNDLTYQIDSELDIVKVYNSRMTMNLSSLVKDFNLDLVWVREDDIKLSIGDHIEITGNHSEHRFPIGTICEITVCPVFGHDFCAKGVDSSNRIKTWHIALDEFKKTNKPLTKKSKHTITIDGKTINISEDSYKSILAGLK